MSIHIYACIRNFFNFYALQHSLQITFMRQLKLCKWTLIFSISLLPPNLTLLDACWLLTANCQVASDTAAYTPTHTYIHPYTHEGINIAGVEVKFTWKQSEKKRKLMKNCAPTSAWAWTNNHFVFLF